MRLSNFCCRRFGKRLLHYPKVLHCDVRRRRAASTFYHRVCKCDNGEQIKNRRGVCCELRGRFMQHFAESGCRSAFSAGWDLQETQAEGLEFESPCLNEIRPYLHLYPHSQSGFCRRAWARSCSTCTASPGRSAAGGWRPDLRPAPPCTSTLLMWPKCDREEEGVWKRLEVTHEWPNMRDTR